jgi:hypothetical protein
MIKYLILLPCGRYEYQAVSEEKKTDLFNNYPPGAVFMVIDT